MKSTLRMGFTGVLVCVVMLLLSTKDAQAGGCGVKIRLIAEDCNCDQINDTFWPYCLQPAHNPCYYCTEVQCAYCCPYECKVYASQCAGCCCVASGSLGATGDNGGTCQETAQPTRTGKQEIRGNREGERGSKTRPAKASALKSGPSC